MIVLVEIWNKRFIGRGIAKPDPDPLVSLNHPVAIHASVLRRGGHSGNLDAGAGFIEGEAVIAALQGIANNFAAMQGRATVAATILKGNRGAVFFTIQNYRIA